jgi:Ser/Thr protein kinase RdoA (MazF antagonist)
MLKFRYLFDKPALTRMLVRNWDYDPESEELFQYFRISANAIYPLTINRQACYLRFSPVSEKLEDNMLAELAFLNYLHKQNYPVMQVVPSKNQEELVKKQTPWGEYYASVFRKVKGTQISQTDFREEIMFSFGETLGELHALSRQYENPVVKRWSHTDVMDWIELTLPTLKLEPDAMRELAFLRKKIDEIPITQKNYGLVHFDFEPDNVFYDDQRGRCHVIDFDDCMYHWYVMDIVQTLDAIKNETGKDDISLLRSILLNGYRSKYTLDEDLLSLEKLFRRFANLYQYTRVARALQERWENEPEWMVNLRIKLELTLERNSTLFGEDLD